MAEVLKQVPLFTSVHRHVREMALAKSSVIEFLCRLSEEIHRKFQVEEKEPRSYRTDSPYVLIDIISMWQYITCHRKCVKSNMSKLLYTIPECLAPPHLLQNLAVYHDIAWGEKSYPHRKFRRGIFPGDLRPLLKCCFRHVTNIQSKFVCCYI